MRRSSVLACFFALVAGAALACGSAEDLSIGRVNDDLPPDAGTGNPPAGTSGSGGSPADAGSGGSSALGGAAQAGASGAPSDCSPGEVPSEASLIHRYRFDGDSTTVIDEVGGQDGVLVGGAALDGTGRLTLDGEDDFVDLPNGLVSGLGDATFVVWTIWDGGAGFQRVFDFGVSRLGEGVEQREQGDSYLALIPFDGTGISVEARTPEMGTVQLQPDVQLTEGELHQLVVVFRSRESVSLFLDAAPLGTVDVSMALSEVVDLNDWLGQSQWENDHTYHGRYDEFRVYDEALGPCAIESLFDAGPDELP
jgi:hypothetical protein